jgi:hypothetical protein
LFGREPAAWAGLLAISVKLLFAFVVHLDGDHQALANAVVAALAGLFVALVTHDGVSAAILGVAQALLALAVGYGLKWSPDQQAVVMSAASAVLAMFVRSQVTAPVPAPPAAAAAQQGQPAVPAQQNASQAPAGTSARTTAQAPAQAPAQPPQVPPAAG